MCYPARHLYEENRNTSAEVQGMSFEIPACEPSSIESLEGDRTNHLQTPQELASRGQHRAGKAMCHHYENFFFSTKAWFKGYYSMCRVPIQPFWRRRDP